MTVTEAAFDLATVLAAGAHSKGAERIIALDVSQRLPFADVFLIASADNERQVRAISEAVEDAAHEQGAKSRRREGLDQGRWVLLDFGDVVVHIQHDEDREFYALESLWKDCPLVALPAPSGAQASDGSAGNGEG